ncbi:hypothetical protein [Candidatus Uabimicrobium amorphum]|uniref:Uncharacterized protein n=1 Tax=Uabimicrobium amorphum TaxID=2596890 RepID=A0A5S9IMY3_UABAM|nr:hypothetical protein [Candidatus Uabimicrobium amorphum]BBM84477.1 hypothetical protein UABAM_02838 [Candidatus Uabimicrobium amorphum]
MNAREILEEEIKKKCLGSDLSITTTISREKKFLKPVFRQFIEEIQFQFYGSDIKVNKDLVTQGFWRMMLSLVKRETQVQYFALYQLSFFYFLTVHGKALNFTNFDFENFPVRYGLEFLDRSCYQFFSYHNSLVSCRKLNCGEESLKKALKLVRENRLNQDSEDFLRWIGRNQNYFSTTNIETSQKYNISKFKKYCGDWFDEVNTIENLNYLKSGNLQNFFKYEITFVVRSLILYSNVILWAEEIGIDVVKIKESMVNIFSYGENYTEAIKQEGSYLREAKQDKNE